MEPKFLSELQTLVNLYVEVKSLILEAEERDARLESNIAVFKEQRDALDHIMRAFGKIFAEGTNAETSYLLHQVDKAKGHLFRAAFDALDGIVVSTSARIREEYLKDVSPEAIQAVLPEYWSDYLPRLETLKTQTIQHRSKKDIGELCEENFTEYKETAFEMLSICNSISSKQSALREFEERSLETERNQNRRNAFYRYVFPIIMVLLGLILGKVVG